MTTPNTPEENAAQMARAAGKQPEPLRHWLPKPVATDTQRIIPYHARTIR